MKNTKLFYLLCLIICFSCKKQIPPTPGAITGPTNFCMGAIGFQYSIAKVEGSDYYLWTVPDDAVIASGQGTTTITVNFGKHSGNICVRSNNSKESSSDASCLWITQECNSNVWCRQSDIGSTFRYQAVGFSIGHKGYVGTGSDGASSCYNDFWEFEPSSSTWSQVASFPHGRFSGLAFAIGSKGYVGLGEDSTSGGTKDFYEFNPSTNRWTRKADFVNVRLGATGFSVGTKGYIVGGAYGGTGYVDLWEYDPTLDTWTAKAPFPAANRTGGIGLSIGNKGYFGAGYNSGTFTGYHDFYEYNPATNVWTPKTSIPPSYTRVDASSFSIGDKGYVGFGYIDDFGYTSYQDLWEYTPSSNSWIQKTPLLNHDRGKMVSFSIDSVGYVIGGSYRNSAGTYFYYNDVWAYRK